MSDVASGKRSRDEKDSEEPPARRKPIIAACDLCRRGKMRCIGKENPPCERCRSAGYDCTFNEGKRGRVPETPLLEGRMLVMENQMQSLSSRVDSILDRLSHRPLAFPDDTAVSATHSSPVFLLSPTDIYLVTGTNPSILPAHGAPRSPERARPTSADIMPASSSPSPCAEGDDEDPFQAAAKSAPFVSMLSAAVATRSDPSQSGSPINTLHGPLQLTTPNVTTGNELRSPGNSIWRDPVDLGLCSVTEGRRLVEQYFENSHDFFPIWDPEYDTWDSLRARSPFAITVLIMVGQIVKDNHRSASNLQLLCRENAERMCKETMFASTGSIETLQAIMILSCWTESSWRSGVHAVSIAMDLGLHRYLPRLAQTYPWKDRQASDDLRRIVIGARVWLGLLKMRLECVVRTNTAEAHRMAYNLGRQIIPYGDESLSLGRLFLEAPFTTLGDRRLVSGCEMLALRVSLHHPLDSGPTPNEELDNRVRQAQRTVKEWESFWDGLYASRGLPQGHVLRELLASEVSHAVLHTTVKVMHSIRNRGDIAALSGERRQWVMEAIRATQRQVNLCLRQNFRDMVRFANLYTFVALAFVGRCLIRFASLCPEEFDLQQAGKDVNDLAELLGNVPGFSFGRLLRRALDNARKARILPQITRPSSPAHDQTLGTGTAALSQGHIPHLAQPPEQAVVSETDLLWAEYFIGMNELQNQNQGNSGVALSNDDPFADLFTFPPLDITPFLPAALPQGESASYNQAYCDLADHPNEAGTDWSSVFLP